MTVDRSPHPDGVDGADSQEDEDKYNTCKCEEDENMRVVL